MFKSGVYYMLLLAPLSAMAGVTLNNGWLSENLYGNDNDVAALKTVRIYKANNGYKVYISNQFKFECDLTFDQAGNPSVMSNCTSMEDSGLPWSVVEKQIKLTCFSTKLEDICKGKYTLASLRSYRDKAEMTIAKRRKNDAYR